MPCFKHCLGMGHIVLNKSDEVSGLYCRVYKKETVNKHNRMSGRNTTVKKRKACNTTMAIQCITVSLSNHEMSYCKMHRPPTHKEFGHYSHVFNSFTQQK